MFSVRQLFKKNELHERIGHLILANKCIPYFHSIPPIANKTIYLVKSVADETVVKGMRLGVFPSEEEVLYLSERVLTQNQVPVKVRNEQLSPIHADDSFTKEGFRKGQIYHFRDLGYLGDKNSDEKVELVTDQLVVFKPIGKNYFYFYTYDELEALKSYRKLLAV